MPALTVALTASALPVAQPAALAQAGSSADFLLQEGQSLERAGDFESALAKYDRLVSAAPEDWRGPLLRGQLRFRLGDIEGSVADLDRVVELDPEREASLWQRGISQYYAGRYAACRAQFELHRSVNPDDVENAVWHFLCVAGSEGFANARRLILPVGPDPRLPMMAIYDLFRGKARVEEVLETAGISSAASELHPDRLFYGYLYVGLYLEAIGQTEDGREHIEKARNLDLPHYMGDVARVHLLARDR